MNTTSFPCEEYFSLNNLEGSSLETEIGYSTLCIPNKLKAAVFILAIVSFFLVLCLSVVFGIKEIMTARRWTWKVQGFILCGTVAGGKSGRKKNCLLGDPDLSTSTSSSLSFLSLLSYFAALTCINAMHLAGVQSCYRYLLYFVPMSMIIMNLVNKIDVWIITTKSIRKLVDPQYARTKHIFKAKCVVNVLCTATFILLFTLLPIVYYDNKTSLNWLYSFAVVSMGVIGGTVGGGLTYLNYRLYKLCQEAAFKLDEDIQAAVDKVTIQTNSQRYPDKRTPSRSRSAPM